LPKAKPRRTNPNRWKHATLRRRGQKRKAEKEVTGEKKPKKQVVIQSDSDTNVEANVLDINASERKRMEGRRAPANIPPAPMDNVSFHSEESVQKWRFVYQRRVAQERELNQGAFECKEITNLLENAELMKTVRKLGNYYKRLVKEFIVNITNDCSEGSEEFRKVRVRGKDVRFSPTTINEYLGINTSTETDEGDLLHETTKEITGGQVQEWPKKGLLSTGSLSVNYASTNHGSGITPMLAKMIYLIGTRRKLNFGNHVFNQTMKHADSFAIKLPISFSCLITGVILHQHPDILRPEDTPSKKPPASEL
jgi:hypothetical protein